MQDINKILWSIAISFIVINSIYYSFKLKFVQFKLFSCFKYLFKKENKSGISPLDTLIMSLSSKIGVGSLSGVALCIYYAGIGSIFWIMVSSFLLSVLTYIENGLSILYKNNKKSGPMYYIKQGLGNKWLSTLYAILVLITYIFLFTSIQNNTIVTLTNDVFSINKVIISLFITILSGLIIMRGIKTISDICNKIFPVMMIVFFIIGLFVFIKNIAIIPDLIKLIITDAFTTKAIVGGIFHTIIFSFQKSIFANEAGVGTSAIISGATNSNDYKLQANLGIISTYFINFIIIGFTSLIIITANHINPSIVNGIEFTKTAFYYHLGYFGEITLLLILFLFSFSTIITIYYYGESALSFITNNKKYINILKIVTIISIFIGGLIKASVIWGFIDTFLAILTIINMYAIYKLKDIIISKLK